MASKLFHAVVGVGISLGSVSACGGAVSFEEGLGASEPDAAEPDTPVEGGIDAAPVTPKPDAGTKDAAPSNDATFDPPDAGANDATADPCCDFTWPITKSGREVCGPYEDCATTEAPWCFGPGDADSCKLYPLQCVGGNWQCMGNSNPTNSPAPPAKCQ